MACMPRVRVFSEEIPLINLTIFNKKLFDFFTNINH